MSLSIKKEQIHRRAKELARLAGESMTEAVDRLAAPAALPRLDKRSPEDVLYDKQGLPK